MYNNFTGFIFLGVMVCIKILCTIVSLKVFKISLLFVEIIKTCIHKFQQSFSHQLFFFSVKMNKPP